MVAAAVGVVAVAAIIAALIAGREPSKTGKQIVSGTTATSAPPTTAAPGSSGIKFQPPLLTSVPAGWTVQQNDDDILSLVPDGLPNSLLTFFRATQAVDPDAAPRNPRQAANATSPLTTDVLDFLRHHRRLTTKSADPIIGMDVPAPGVEATVSSGYDCVNVRCVWLFGLSQVFFALNEPNENVIYEVHTGHDVVLMSLESPNGELARFRAKAIPLITSIHFAR